MDHYRSRLVTMVDIDAADNLSKSPREVAGALFAEMSLGDVPAVLKGHFIINRRKPSEGGIGALLPWS